MKRLRITLMRLWKGFFEAGDSSAAILMDDGTVRTRRGEVLVELPGPANIDRRWAEYEAWCRRAARAIDSPPARTSRP